jgi:probable rRNA maturation factor
MIEVNNLTRFDFDEKTMRRIGEGVLASEHKEKIDLSVVLAESEDSRKLNEKYRQINRPTDVLSFTFESSGEIILCPQIVKENAKKYGEIFEREFYRVLIHGILHILGYDHEADKKAEEEMFKKQENYLSKLLTTNC